MPRHIRPGSDHARKHRTPSAQKLFELMFLPPPLRPKYAFLVHARSKKFFFDTVANRHARDSENYKRIESAFRYLKHATRYRWRDTGEPESEHPISCALIYMIADGGSDADEIIALLLHDMVETFRDLWPIERISRLFGSNVARLVAGMTKPPRSGSLKTDDEVDVVYFQQLAGAERAVVRLKEIDRRHNTLTLRVRTFERAMSNLSESITRIVPLLNKHRLPQVRDFKQIIVFAAKSMNAPRPIFPR